MTKRRMIHEAFFQSEGVGEWTMRQRLLVIGMISIADDQGRLKGNPLWLRAQIFPYDMIAADEIKADLEAIESCNDTICLYSIDDRDYIQLMNWWEYQNLQWAKPSDFPAPDDWQDQIRQMVYKPKRWVMTVNWPNSPDVISYEESKLLGNTLGNEAGDSLPIINTNINNNTKDPLSENGSKPQVMHEMERDHLRGEYVSVIAGVVKETFSIGYNDNEFEQVADAVINLGATIEQVKAFEKWWEKNGHYKGRPALKSFVQSFKDSIEPVKEEKPWYETD